MEEQAAPDISPLWHGGHLQQVWHQVRDQALYYPWFDRNQSGVVKQEPQIDVTMANVFVPFPGAVVADVENQVTVPMEKVLSEIAGVEHVYSISRPGVAVLTVQFKVGVPRTEALVRLYDVLNANQDWLPRDLGTLAPIVKPKGIDDVPVLGVMLWSPDASSAHELERVARTLETELKGRFGRFVLVGGVATAVGLPGALVVASGQSAETLAILTLADHGAKVLESVARIAILPTRSTMRRECRRGFELDWPRTFLTTNFPRSLITL